MTGFENVSLLHFYQFPFLWKYSFLKPAIKLFSKITLRYKPMHDIKLPLSINNLIRFSKDVILFAVSYKK